MPWLVGNPIYLLPAVAEPVGAEPLVETVLALNDVDWLLEKEPTSTATIAKDGTGFTEDYQLGSGAPRWPLRTLVRRWLLPWMRSHW